MIEGLGVEIETGRKLGRDFTIADLKKKGYEAVFLAVGTPDGVQLNIPGADARGVVDAIAFLREYNLRGSARVGKKVVVVGGGNAAIDAARTALRLGAEVTVVYRRTEAEMPAYAEEIEQARQEGVTLRTLTSPEEVLVKNGEAAGLRCHRMKLGEYDRSGRRRPLDSGDEFVIEADQVILAVGQTLDGSSLFRDAGLEMNADGTVKTDETTGRTSVPWIFAGGDAATGPASVVDAVAGGERAAVGMDRMFNGGGNAFWRAEAKVETAFDPDAEPLALQRAHECLRPVAERRTSFAEVELTWSETTARGEARRCLRCDYRESCN